MSNKVNLIKQELEKRLSLLWDLIPEGEKVLQDDFTKEDANNLGKYTELESLLRFIDSLPEEHNEDLEEAADQYALRDSQAYKGVHCTYSDDKIAFIAGAKWQRKKDQETIELAEEHALLAGMMKEREEMMKDAADSKITTDGNSIFPIIKYQLPLTYDCKIGDKVKLIIIKEEQQ